MAYLGELRLMAFDDGHGPSGWLPCDGANLQVVSISSVPVRPLVDGGKFLEALFYRLNVISLEATRNRAAGRGASEPDRLIREAGPASGAFRSREQSFAERLAVTG